MCRSVETLDHALGDCLFHKVVFAILRKMWEPLRVKEQQYVCGSIQIVHLFNSPQGIAQWTALAVHWTLHNTYRRGGVASLEALLTIWIKLTALLVKWEPLPEFSHVFHIYHDQSIHFKNDGVVTGPCIVYVESSEKEEGRQLKRRRKDDRTQEFATIAIEQLKQAQARGLPTVYNDGSTELVARVGWIAGYGCHEPGRWEEANHLPPQKKQSIHRAALTAVIVAVWPTATRSATFAVATDSSYVYGGVQGSAVRWRAQHWVTSKEPVLNVDLWIELLDF